jgi:hypothetical protein
MNNHYYGSIYLTFPGAEQAIKFYSHHFSKPLLTGQNQLYQFASDALVARPAGINKMQYNVVATRPDGEILILAKLCALNKIPFDARWFDHVVN